MIRREDRAIWIIAAAAAVARALLFLGTDLYADEAYYWFWSTRPAAGYFDHPPLVAWVAGASSLVPGELGLRLLFLVCGALTVVFTAFTARELTTDRRAPAIAALLAATAPMLTLTGSLALPDAPQLAALSCATWLAVSASGPMWIAVGLAWGLALLGKYSSALFGVGVLASALVDPMLRAELRTRWPWLGVGTAVLVFLPCLAWNAAHDFVSFKFQLRHGFNDAGFGAHFLEYVGAVIGGAGPVVLFAAAAWFVRDRSSASKRLLFMVIVPLAVTTYSGLKGTVEANWPAIAYPAICAAAAAMLIALRRAGPILISISAALGVLVALAFALELRAPRHLRPDAPPIERMHGWKDQVAAIREACGGPETFVVTSGYQAAAELAFYGGMRRFGPTYARPSQFDVWYDAPSEDEKPCIVAFRSPDTATKATLGLTADTQPQRIDAIFAATVIRTLWVFPPPR